MGSSRQVALLHKSHFHIPAARCARVAYEVSAQEGTGNAGRSMRPQPRVQNRKHTSIVTAVTPVTPGIPCAMVLTVSFVLSPVTGLFVTVASGGFFANFAT